MTRNKFESMLRMAKTFQELGDRTDFWAGFQRGLRRQFHGENFGTEAEHQKWLGLAREHESRRELGVGYRLGFYFDSLRLTTDHSTSSYGIPVFVNAEGNPLDYTDGLRRLREIMDWSVQDLADLAGVSPRTVEGWEQGRMPSTSALLLIKKFLEARP